MTFGHLRIASLAGAIMLVNASACSVATREGPASQERTWPAYLGSSRRASQSGDAPGADAQPVWRTRLARGINGAPALGEDVIAVSQTDRQVALLERATGDVIWRRRLDLGLGAGPLLADDRLFVAEQTETDARVYALRLSDGRTLWSQEAGDVQAPLATEGDALYAANTLGVITRFSAATGRRVWRVRMGAGVRAAPVPVPDGVVIATVADTLYLLDAASGQVRQRRATQGAVLGAPAFAESLLVVGTARGWIEAFDAATLEPRWAVPLDEPIAGAVAAFGGAFHAMTTRGLLASVPARGSHAARRVRMSLVARAGPAPSQHGVYVSGVNGELALVDSSGARRWTTRVGGPLEEPPLVDGRTLIVVTGNGEVVVFR